MNRKSILSAVFALLYAGAMAQSPASWYESTRENRPYVRWWWHGSAVDRPGLSYNMEEFARAGIGGVEITPIYGVQGNEANDIPFLSPKWMDMYKFTLSKAASLDLEVDMNCGTGWPFGGPEITPELAAQKMKIENGTIRTVPTGQKVKRAAPGGEGFVMNHYDPEALKVYLEKFDKAFKESGAAFPDTWFNDSYEVYGADWTASLPEIFKRTYGYDIVEKLVAAKGDERLRALCDYRECLGQILQDNFFKPWIQWAHSHGARVRNQSHGSPANILDLYASVDIPECETFGRSDFDIPGLRQDAIKRPNDGDPSALKFASSAAHLTGKKYVSCETLTWLTEHFRTSLSQAKPEIDRAFCAGVNHIFFHGATYSPCGVQFPGWLFYASVNMSPTSSMWRDSPALFKYIERCQAFLTAGSPDSDFLLYMPVYDCWSKYDERAMVTFVIHSMDKTIPELKAAMNSIVAAGFDADYISDRLLQECDVKKPVIVPFCKYMPLQTAKRLLELENSGVPVYFIGNLPEDVPGLSDLEARRKEFRKIVRKLGDPVSFDRVFAKYTPETFRTECGGEMIRRVNEAGGYNYFLALTGSKGVDGWVKLAKGAESAVIFDAMFGKSGKARIRKISDGCAEVRLQMEPGQSLMLKTFPTDVEAPEWQYVENAGPAETLDAAWSISFPESSPAINGSFSLPRPVDWTTLDIPGARINHGTARYTTTIAVDPLKERPDDWILDLGDVRESAEVRINGEYAGTLVSVPFKLPVGRWLKPGINTLDIYVTNLASNRIADYDRRGVKWRIFKNANIATLSDPDFGKWETDPSGLVTDVTLTPVTLSSRPALSFPDGSAVDPWFTSGPAPVPEAERKRFVITDYGVLPDSTILQTTQIQKVIDLAAGQGGTVVIPDGVFLTSSLFFKPHTHLHLEKGAVLKGSDNFADYAVAPVHIEGVIQPYIAAIINAYGVDGFTITGEGTIDGDGLRYWRGFWKRREVNRACTNLEALRPRMIYVANSSDVHIEAVTLLNSGFWNMHLYKCTRVRVKDVTIWAPGPGDSVKSPSSDGIDVDGCCFVHISGCSISNNDDQIALKGGKGPWADTDKDNACNERILIENCSFGPHSSAVTCGSECIGVKNMIIRNCTVNGSAQVLNLKMRKDTPQHYEYILMENVTGTARCFIQVRPWTQFFDLKDRKDIPMSYAGHVTALGCDVVCSKQVFNTPEAPDQYLMTDFVYKDCHLTLAEATE